VAADRGVFFTARGHKVFRVSSQKAADLHWFLSRHAKTNGIDADTLARLPLVSPAGLQPLGLPGAGQAALDRRVRATDRLTRQAADHKRRIKNLACQLLPLSPLTGDLGAAGLAVLERLRRPPGPGPGRPGPAHRAESPRPPAATRAPPAPASGWTPPKAPWSSTAATRHRLHRFRPSA